MAYLFATQLSADGTYYNLYRGYFLLDSGLAQTLLSLKPADDKEGTDDSHPIVVPGIKAAEFDHFLLYQLRQYVYSSCCMSNVTSLTVVLTCSQLPRDNEEALTAIFNVARFFQYEAAQREAFEALDQLSSFGPVSRLVLGMSHGIREWIAAGFRELVRPAGSRVRVSLEEARRLDVDTFHLVMDTRFLIEEHRRLLAYCEPTIRHTVTCQYNIECELGWTQEWKMKVARYLMHPDHAVSGRDLLTQLEGVEISRVHTPCRDRIMAVIREGGQLTYEDVIIDRVLKSIGA